MHLALAMLHIFNSHKYIKEVHLVNSNYRQLTSLWQLDARSMFYSANYNGSMYTVCVCVCTYAGPTVWWLSM